MNVKCSCQFCYGHIECQACDCGRHVNCPHCGQDIALVPSGRYNRIIAAAAHWIQWQRLGTFLAGAASICLVFVALHEPRYKRIDREQLDAEMKERVFQAKRVFEKKFPNQYWFTPSEFKQYKSIIRTEKAGLRDYNEDLLRRGWLMRSNLIMSLCKPATKFMFPMSHADRIFSEHLHLIEVREAGLPPQESSYGFTGSQ